jgi:hypothetical protein
MLALHYCRLNVITNLCCCCCCCCHPQVLGNANAGTDEAALSPSVEPEVSTSDTASATDGGAVPPSMEPEVSTSSAAVTTDDGAVPPSVDPEVHDTAAPTSGSAAKKATASLDGTDNKKRQEVSLMADLCFCDLYIYFFCLVCV